MSGPDTPDYIDAELIKIRQKYPETFRKSLAYYVGAQVPRSEETTMDEWRKTVLRTVDLALLGIEQSGYQLVPPS